MFNGLFIFETDQALYFVVITKNRSLYCVLFKAAIIK